ncbi:MAG TPA: EamA family transporter [Chitinophagaceae bacterium]|jgi:drug/metabolite transporter (DMT)-like permease|nr:EamA family transporter [Chitinophagaceae bacterium]
MSTATVYREPSKTLIIAAFAALYLIWGSTYIAIRIALESIPPFLMAGSRFFIAGVLLYLWCRFRGQPTPSPKSFLKISWSGILMLFCGTGSLVWAEQYIPSGLASIIVATLPLWFVLIDKRHWSYHLSNKWIIGGLIIGFAGVLLLFVDKKITGISGSYNTLLSIIVLTAGTIVWAIGSLYAKYTEMEGSAAMKASIQMMAAGALALIVGLIIGEQNKMPHSTISTNSLLALLYLITMGSLVAYMAYVWLLEVRPPSLVGTYAYVNPVVAVFLGWWLLNEAVSRQQLFALGIILSGVVLVNFSKDKIKKL